MSKGITYMGITSITSNAFVVDNAHKNFNDKYMYSRETDIY